MNGMAAGVMVMAMISLGMIMAAFFRWAACRFTGGVFRGRLNNDMLPDPAAGIHGGICEGPSEKAEDRQPCKEAAHVIDKTPWRQFRKSKCSTVGPGTIELRSS